MTRDHALEQLADVGECDLETYRRRAAALTKLGSAALAEIFGHVQDARMLAWAAFTDSAELLLGGHARYFPALKRRVPGPDDLEDPLNPGIVQLSAPVYPHGTVYATFRWAGGRWAKLGGYEVVTWAWAGRYVTSAPGAEWAACETFAHAVAAAREQDREYDRLLARTEDATRALLAPVLDGLLAPTG